MVQECISSCFICFVLYNHQDLAGKQYYYFQLSHPHAYPVTCAKSLQSRTQSPCQIIAFNHPQANEITRNTMADAFTSFVHAYTCEGVSVVFGCSLPYLGVGKNRFFQILIDFNHYPLPIFSMQARCRVYILSLSPVRIAAVAV